MDKQLKTKLEEIAFLLESICIHEAIDSTKQTVAFDLSMKARKILENIGIKTIEGQRETEIRS